MLIDFHAHSSGISRCCKIDGENMLLVAKSKGIDGVVLTNHYDKNYVTIDAAELAKRYIKEFLLVKSYEVKYNIKVFFGIEVTLARHNNAHMLIYGVDCNFLLKYPDIFYYEQKELYKLVKEHGGILVQAHPLRGGKNVLLDFDYLDGVEINCHPLYDGSHIKFLSKIAKENNFILTCGGDFHNDTHRAKCGVYLDDSLTEMEDIVLYLTTSKVIKMFIQEPDSMEGFEYLYEK